MSLLLLVKKKISAVKWWIIWHYQYALVRLKNLIPLNLSPLLLDSSDKILVLAPHADDEWIGCYSILKRMSNNTTCCYMNMYGNDYSEYNIRTRTDEIKDSARYWGFNLSTIEKFEVHEIKNCIISHDVCFIPSPYDWHPEHRKAFCLFYQAFCHLGQDEKQKIRVYYYMISVPHSKREEMEYCKLSKKDVSLKWSMFAKIYPSQAYMPSERYKLQLRLVPKYVGYAAQLFVKVDEKRMSNDFNSINKLEVIDVLNQSLHDICNILKSRSIIDRIIYSIS